MSTQQKFSEKSFRKKKETHSSFSYFLRHYFIFNKIQRNGTIFTISLILFFVVFTIAYRVYNYQTPADTTELQKQLNVFFASAEKKKEHDSIQVFIADEMAKPSQAASQLFAFNPNTATEEDFIKLGLTKKQATGILNYRNKGGKFRKKEDFAKMYTISKQEYERMEAFIVIPVEETKQNSYTEQKTHFENKDYPTKQKAIVELNTADSLELISLRGIGPYTAMKIIELREKLGGFYSKEQLREVYRVDSARYAEIESFIAVDPFQIKKLNINTATLDELKVHPYIRYNIANSLVSIRQQHGHFTSIEGIRKSHLVTEDVFRKIAPYLSIE